MGTRTPQAEFAGLKFGPASLLHLNDLHRQWYDWTMKAGAKPEFLKAPVAWYLAGAEEWRYAPTLEAITSDRLAMNLDSHGEANDVYTSGTLGAIRASESASDRYVYDPMDVGPAALADGSDAPGLTDQRSALLNRGRSLVYHSAPFERDTDIAGFFRFTAFIAIDQPDTDFDVQVWEVRKDGSAIALAGDRMRAILANMTTMSRLSPFFQERTVAEDANFFDLLKLLGFQQITITDGDKVTHQVDIR